MAGEHVLLPPGLFMPRAHLSHFFSRQQTDLLEGTQNENASSQWRYIASAGHGIIARCWQLLFLLSVQSIIVSVSDWVVEGVLVLLGLTQ